MKFLKAIRPPVALLCVAALSLAAGVLWVCAFPIATVSTGRWGARATFVSENALPHYFVPKASPAAVPAPLANASLLLTDRCVRRWRLCNGSCGCVLVSCTALAAAASAASPGAH